MKRNINIIIILAIVLLVSSSIAGVVMNSQIQDLQDKKNKPMAQIVYLQKDKIRIDMKAEDIDVSMIFHGDEEVFWMIDHKKKTGTIITKDELEKLSKEMEQAMESMDEAMKELPAEMQAKMKEMMQAKQTAQSKIRYKKVGSNEKVNQWICNKYEGYANNKKEIEIWTTGWEKLGLKKEDVSCFEKMGQFFSSMMKNKRWAYKVGIDEKEKDMYYGFPVKTITFEKNKAKDQFEILSVKQEELKETVFQFPKGYKKESFINTPH